MADPDDDTDRSPDESDDEGPAEFDPDRRSDGDADSDGPGDGDPDETDVGGDDSPGPDEEAGGANGDDGSPEGSEGAADGTDGSGEEDADGDRSDERDGDRRDGPDGDRVGVTIEDGTETAGREFGGGADPGEDPYDAGPDAESADYGPGPEDRRAGSDRTWTDEDGLRSEMDRLWEELEGLEDHVEGRTVSKEAFEAEMKRYVRWRLRKGHVTGWGPYVVLLYGTGMTLGAFYYLEGPWAILAMLVAWLSTLGLYVVMVMLGVGIGGIRFAWKYLEKARSLRSSG